MRWWLLGFLALGQVGEELGHALVLVGLLASHDPQAGTADDGVLRRAGNVGVVGQGGDAALELGVALDVAVQG